MKPISTHPKRRATSFSGNLLLLLILLTATINAAAATFTVTNTGNTGAGSLRQAITDANAAAGSDTIVFSALFSSPQTITVATTLVINGVNDTLTITGPGPTLLTVSGNNAVQVFSVSTGEITSISGITVAQGNAISTGSGGGGLRNDGTLTLTNTVFTGNNANTFGNGLGGAIFHAGNGTTLTINDSVITGNMAFAGGGISTSGTNTLNINNSTISNNSCTTNGAGGILSNSTMNISGSTITGNTTPSIAGGIFSVGIATITGSTISNNIAGGSDGSNHSGGGIYTQAVMNITNTVISGNQATQATFSGGGGITGAGGAAQLTITNSTITGNSAARGGAMYWQPNGSLASLTMTNSTISSNTANTGGGGGLDLEEMGPVNISGTTISGNMAMGGGSGGGILRQNASDTLTVTNSTISGNMAGNGGGILGGGVENLDSVTVVNNTATGSGGGLNATSGGLVFNFHNTIFANNTAPTGTDIAGSVVSQGYNLIKNTAGATISGSTATNITGQDPNLGPLQNNGGPTLTHALLAGSPAVDKGGPTSLIIDQRGSIRTFDNAAIPNAAGGNGTDIGAFEIELPVVAGVVSRKVHGGAGTFDISLLTTPPVTECRAGGAGGNYQVIVTFANPVSVSGLSIMSSNGLASGTQSVSGAVVTVDLAAVANVQTLGITLINVNDGVRVGDVFIPLGVLVGDTTGNGSVTSSDIGQVKAQSGQTVTAANFRTDVTANGGISASDIGLVKSNAGTQLP